MGTVLIIIILVIALFPVIRRGIALFLAHRAEDYIRKATGMPPRPGSKRARRESAGNKRTTSGYGQSAADFSGASSRRRKNRRHNPDEPLIPKEYAEDVEFVETISYSETTIGASSSDGRNTVYHESQVSDVEWEEIRLTKTGASKKRG